MTLMTTYMTFKLFTRILVGTSSTEEIGKCRHPIVASPDMTRCVPARPAFSEE